MSIYINSQQPASSPHAFASPPEVWGGVEYTCNRVGGRYFDQMELSGHAHRLSDYEAIAELGIKTLRFGMLWERHEAEPSWNWFDERLQCLREAGVRPIAGLLHHGSGPGHTSLLDPEFPRKLATYARQVAERYPWIDAYTPVNEPNTTARFSGMYGVWYPHHRSRASYLRALLNQLKGTVLSMQAIRAVNAKAKLIQTEDLGSIDGTEALRPTWEGLSLRRWLPLDLLCGHVDRHHPMYHLLLSEGISPAEALWFSENPCPPDIVGINYYPTSDRFLDHRLELYAAAHRSSEGRFVDVESVRIRPEGIDGFASQLTETWNRYKLPVAITEVHLGGSVDDQIRWLASAWEGIARARREGAQCIGLTIWALLGSFYWNSLVTCDNGYYEPGAFDVRGGHPQQTELAEVVRQLASGQTPRHPALARPGWWQRDDRICFTHPEKDTEMVA